jgi:hypothetical protein
MHVTQEIDEVILNYAEIKALATGNPYIIERCKLDAEVNKQMPKALALLVVL